MDSNKIRVAITQGDTNGVGLELIFKTFSEPEMLELCTPIIYGSPKVASYHSKALDIHCQFSIINKIDDVRDGRVNLMACVNEDLKVDFGKPNDESAAAAARSLAAAAADCASGNADVLVCAPMAAGGFKVGSREYACVGDYLSNVMSDGSLPLTVYQNNMVRMAAVSDDGIRQIADTLTEQNITLKVQALHDMLSRDFLIAGPRIAIMALDSRGSEKDDAIVQSVMNNVKADGIEVFGPYQSERLFVGRGYESFDGILAMYHEQGMLPMKMLSDVGCVAVFGGLTGVCVMPDCDAQMETAGQGIADESVFRDAIYDGIDIFRARLSYDEAYENPLEKLYKERPDSGEKMRFSIPKKKGE